MAVRVAWTSATGTASRDPTPPLRVGQGLLRARSKQRKEGGLGGWEDEETVLENVRDDNYALQVIARLQLNGAGGLACVPFLAPSSINRAERALKRELSSENHGF